jgi:hypothetical protein
VVSIAGTSDESDLFASATIKNDSHALLQGMSELLAKQGSAENANSFPCDRWLVT